MKILITGGSGNLAKSIVAQYSDKHIIQAPNKETMNICEYKKTKEHLQYFNPDWVIHAGSFTIPMEKHEKDPIKSINTNIVGTSNIATLCCKYNIKLCYISTDYVYNGYSGKQLFKEDDEVKPMNAYSWSKLGGECAVNVANAGGLHTLILRCSFTEYPFRHKKAFIDCYKSFLWTDQVPYYIIKLIEGNAKGIYNVGGERNAVYYFIKSRQSNIEKNSIEDVTDWKVPRSTALNIDKLKDFLNR